MCQCLLCDCIWVNCFGVCCAGCYEAYFCISCWLCKPDGMEKFDDDCCHCCTWTGFGGNCLFEGCVYCAPDYLKNYSRYVDGEQAGGVPQESPANQ